MSYGQTRKEEDRKSDMHPPPHMLYGQTRKEDDRNSDTLSTYRKSDTACRRCKEGTETVTGYRSSDKVWRRCNERMAQMQ